MQQERDQTERGPVKETGISPGAVPVWFPVCAAIFGGLTLFFFMGLVLLAIVGYQVPAGSKFAVIAVLALGCGLSSNFLGGSAAARGSLPLPNIFKEHPIYFGVTGGIAVTVIVLILGYVFYARSGDLNETVEGAFRTVEDLTRPERDRLDALRRLREDHEWKDFKGRDLSNLVLPTYGWAGMNLTEAKLRYCILRNANLRGVELVRADLTNADLRGADFRGSGLNGIVMNGADCRAANFDGVMLTGGSFRKADFSRADLRYTFLQATDFSWASFVLADLYAATFDGGDPPHWHKSNITGAQFGGASVLKVNFMNLIGIDMADFKGARYDSDTKFPDGFDPTKGGMRKE